MTTTAEAFRHAQSLFRAGNCSDAIAVCHQILGFSPDNCATYFLLGVILIRQNNPVGAADCFRNCLKLRPDFSEAHNNLGVILAKEKESELAIHHFDASLYFRPKYTDASINRARLLQEFGRIDEAVEQLQSSLDDEPSNANLHVELGYALMRQGDFEEAVSHYELACQLGPQHAEAHWNLAMTMLTLGDFQSGWKEYEWRWKCSAFAPFAPAYDWPKWDGSPLDGKTVLLHAEQGFGDTFQFIRFASLLKAQNSEVVFHCQPKVKRLLSKFVGIDRWVSFGEPTPPCDVHASLLSLPFNLGTTLETLPATVPYLHAEAALVEHWRKELDPIQGFKIGIAWQGNSIYQYDGQRSFPLKCFEPLAKIPGVRLISLQKGDGIEQIAANSDRFAVEDYGSRIDAGEDAFVDTAAVIMALDLVIGCDSAIVHLAGALGAPVWLPLAKVADWRWLLNRQDSPWYPTMRLFRQTEMGDWAAVFDRIAVALSSHCL